MSRRSDIHRQRLEAESRWYRESGGAFSQTPKFVDRKTQQRWEASKAAAEELRALEQRKDIAS